MAMNSSNPRLARILLLVAIFAVYMPLMGGDFVWDDHLLVLENQLTGSLLNIPSMFMSDLWHGTPVPDADPGYYRPLMVIDLALTRAVAGLSAQFHHLHNLAWHIAAVLLLLRLLERVLKDERAAVLGTAVFALHPVQLEVVGFVSARNDPMAVTWLLGALLLLSPKNPSRKALIAGAFAAAAAMLSKENVVFAPVLLAFAAKARWGGWGRVGSHIAVLSGFGIAFGCRALAGVGWPAQADVAHLKAVGAPAFAFYLEKLVWPVDIAPVIHFAWLPAIPWLGAALALVLLAVMAVFGGALARAGLGFALLGLLPAWAAVAHVGAIVDRYLYLPMVGIAWAVAAVARRGKVPHLLIGVVLIWLSGLSMRQVPVWGDDERLWTASIDRAPSGYAKGALARWLEDHDRDDDAAYWYREAVIQPPMPFEESCFNITRIHLKRRDPVAAVRVGQEALNAGCAASPELVAPLALAQALTGAWPQAHRSAAALDQDPTGKAFVASLAASAAMGDVGPLSDAINSITLTQGQRLRAQVVLVVSTGGGDVGALNAALDAR
jgi:hypothetical protein